MSIQPPFGLQGGSDDSSDDEPRVSSSTLPVHNGDGSKGNKPWVPAIDNPNYFEALTPGEIYDSFFNIRRMGFIANRIIRKLNETKHIVSSKILEKRKKLKALQRKQFEQLSPAGVEYLKVLLKMEIAALKSSAQSVESGLNLSPNVKARLAHLAADVKAVALLNHIYAADGPHSASTPIPSGGTLDLWQRLANEFVNSPNWIPVRVMDDRLYDVDPCSVPTEMLTAESLRSAFSRLRIDYTKALLKFHSAPKASLTPEGLDVEFWERYAKHDKGLYYVYLLFKGRTEQDCLIVDMALSRTDNELDHVLQTYNSNVPTLGSKRDHSMLSSAQLNVPSLGVHHEDEVLMMVDGDHVSALAGMSMALHGRGSREELGDEPAWQAAVRKDRAISNYYKRLSINHDVRFYLDLLLKDTTGEAMKRNIRNKINTLLLKKVEDRYDDLSF